MLEKNKVHKYKNITMKVERDKEISIKGNDRIFTISDTKNENSLIMSIQNEHTDITMNANRINVNEGLSFTTLDTAGIETLPVVFSIMHDSEPTLIIIERVKKENNWWETEEK